MPDQRRKELAEKLMSVKKTVGLSVSEKKEIYQFLTGEIATTMRKGAPTTIERDKTLALHNLLQKYFTGKFDLSIIGTSISDRAAYRALKRGVDALEKDSIDALAVISHLLKLSEDLRDRLGTGLIYHSERQKIANEMSAAEKNKRLWLEITRLIEICRNK